MAWEAGRNRTDPQYGNIFDHFGIEFVYPNDIKTISMCRQIAGTTGRVSERVVGTKGSSDCGGHIEGENAWHYEGPTPNPLRSGAHRSYREHSRRQAAQRRRADRRKHALRHHGPVNPLTPGRSLSAAISCPIATWISYRRAISNSVMRRHWMQFRFPASYEISGFPSKKKRRRG